MKNIIGTRIKYYDYLGSERFGSIIATEPYPDDPEILYCYIEDDDPDENINQDVVCGINILYATLRPSNEVYIDEQ